MYIKVTLQPISWSSPSKSSLQAMCVGAFIVDAQWLSDCASLSRVLPPEEYEV
jgi:hypothetical protein